MDRNRFSTIAHEGITFWNPIGEALVFLAPQSLARPGIAAIDDLVTKADDFNIIGKAIAVLRHVAFIDRHGVIGQDILDRPAVSSILFRHFIPRLSVFHMPILIRLPLEGDQSANSASSSETSSANASLWPT